MIPSQYNPKMMNFDSPLYAMFFLCRIKVGNPEQARWANDKHRICFILPMSAASDAQCNIRCILHIDNHWKTLILSNKTDCLLCLTHSKDYFRELLKKANDINSCLEGIVLIFK